MKCAVLLCANVHGPESTGACMYARSLSALVSESVCAHLMCKCVRVRVCLCVCA